MRPGRYHLFSGFGNEILIFRRRWLKSEHRFALGTAHFYRPGRNFIARKKIFRCASLALNDHWGPSYSLKSRVPSGARLPERANACRYAESQSARVSAPKCRKSRYLPASEPDLSNYQANREPVEPPGGPARTADATRLLRPPRIGIEIIRRIQDRYRPMYTRRGISCTERHHRARDGDPWRAWPLSTCSHPRLSDGPL
jgi:hypothetical protein